MEIDGTALKGGFLAIIMDGIVFFSTSVDIYVYNFLFHVLNMCFV